MGTKSLHPLWTFGSQVPIGIRDVARFSCLSGLSLSLPGQLYGHVELRALVVITRVLRSATISWVGPIDTRPFVQLGPFSYQADSLTTWLCCFTNIHIYTLTADHLYRKCLSACADRLYHHLHNVNT